VSHADGKSATNVWVEVHRAVVDEGHPDVVDEELTMPGGGKFRIDALSPGQYKLIAHSMGAADSEPLVVAAGTEGVELRLGAELSISGIARFKDGRPAAGVRVKAKLHGTREPMRPRFRKGGAVTGADGTFVVEGLRPGDYDLVATAGREGGADVRTATVKNIAAGTAGVVIEVEPGLVISGRVLGPDGAPVAKGAVTCSAAAATEESNATDEDDPEDASASSDHAAEVHDGAFEAKGLSPGKYDVSVAVEGFAAQHVRVDAGAKDVVFHLTKGGTIKGRVLRVDGKPAACATVMIEDEEEAASDSTEVETDPEGRFVLEHVAAGVHRVTATLDDDEGDTFEGEVKGVRVAEDQTVENVEIRLKKSE